ncbi:trypsin-like peptidase domain-containing protein [Candidatus Dojkabacteria bacterium]|uniref:Trypsin-like peptidase domain-containing protein n=1 Tax=Candidatus Dojkabacteria bacterium TaxID=2099670 RepID=A0A955LAC9_9BACT|nr:trypsin-like peptidase domain-containing protein [Candidatus Dojkabacteria bacterium]
MKKKITYLTILSILSLLLVFSGFLNIQLLVANKCNLDSTIFSGLVDSSSCSTQNSKAETIRAIPTSFEDGTNVAEIFLESNKSVVGIGTLDQNEDTTGIIGTGFVVTNDGYIATNQHVVSNEDASYYVKFPDDDTAYTVQEIYRDRINDIAIIKIDKNDLSPLPLGDSSAVTPGESVVAIGNPLGELYSTVTSGIVSAVNRTVEIDNSSFLRTDVSRFEDTIQTDAAINPGNSGGPLINSMGEVIGINFATIRNTNNLSFAIPIEYLRSRLDELKEYGDFKIAYVGIGYSVNSYRLGDQVVIGARVLSVDLKGSAVEVLQENDIITKFAGVSLSEDSLFRLIQTQKIGDTVGIEFYRDGELMTDNITIIQK